MVKRGATARNRGASPQSAVPGVAMIVMAYGPNPVGIVSVAPFVAFGAFYFAVSDITKVDQAVLNASFRRRRTLS